MSQEQRTSSSTTNPAHGTKKTNTIQLLTMTLQLLMPQLLQTKSRQAVTAIQPRQVRAGDGRGAATSPCQHVVCVSLDCFTFFTGEQQLGLIAP